ncbi:hypothetical protein [Floridanema evergladense]|uniref:Uncharacterized protein n=1 Tax=Floridaenema evergladense BLCC-F167 TaxID=3153639 RepID=A0ABV4WTS2_9CYAN
MNTDVDLVSKMGMAMNDFDSTRHFFGNLYFTLERSPPGSSIESNINQGDIYWIDLGQPIGSDPAQILAGLALVTEPEAIGNIVVRVHYGIEVYGKIFDNLSSFGLSPEDWVKDFSSFSNNFEVEIIEEF